MVDKALIIRVISAAGKLNFFLYVLGRSRFELTPATTISSLKQ